MTSLQRILLSANVTGPPRRWADRAPSANAAARRRAVGRDPWSEPGTMGWRATSWRWAAPGAGAGAASRSAGSVPGRPAGGPGSPAPTSRLRTRRDQELGSRPAWMATGRRSLVPSKTAAACTVGETRARDQEIRRFAPATWPDGGPERFREGPRCPCPGGYTMCGRAGARP